MKVKEKRKLLRELNKEARSKATLLKEAGYTGSMTEPPTVNASKVESGELIRHIEDLQIYTRSQLSTVEGMSEFVDSTLSTLHRHGYNFVNETNLSDFGEFMNFFRDKNDAKAYPSNEVAELYKNMQRLGISSKVMERNFKDFLTDQEGIVDILEALEELDLPENRKRISSTEVREQLESMGLL